MLGRLAIADTASDHPHEPTAIAFTPTTVMLEKARVVGDRIYLVPLLADADGEKTIATFSRLQPAPTEPLDR